MTAEISGEVESYQKEIIFKDKCSFFIHLVKCFFKCNLYVYLTDRYYES